MFSLIMCIGTWPGPSIITCTSCFQAICVSSPSVASSANWPRRWRRRWSRAQAVAELKLDVVRLHDLADVLEVLVEEDSPCGARGTIWP